MAHVNLLVIRVPDLPLNFPHCARRHAKLDYDLLDSLTCLEPLTYSIRKRHVIFKLPRYDRPMSSIPRSHHNCQPHPEASSKYRKKDGADCHLDAVMHFD